MTGGAYMGEMLITVQVWLKSVCELLDKQLNAQKESFKKLPEFTQAFKTHNKVYNENETRKK